ncbi:LOW QUALITY PROTEIN: hypothetical protein PHPALM_28678 [Phytophthora palmivora]|uniref:Uncharacterized protein n=1 Tax=Phytophthora palmivora TaxID=4796 RepID=A0A2P4X9H1_9STRA|nr:LOW QUALITY PROTEIN: hypothetical protein PHPALM_28678 [Phytophthora palmivora]
MLEQNVIVNLYEILRKHFIAALDFFDRSAQRFNIVKDWVSTVLCMELMLVLLALIEEQTRYLHHHPPKVNSKPTRKERRLSSSGDTSKKVANLFLFKLRSKWPQQAE